MEDLRNRFFYFIEKAGVSFYGRYLRHRRFNRQFDYFLELMSRNRPVEEIYSWQEYQFKNIWPYIRENEFYKQRVKHLNGLTGPLLRSPQWEMIPIIDKGTMRKHFAEIANIQKSKGFIKKNTSGTTGEKFKFYQDKLFWTLNSAVTWRQYSWMGILPFDKRITIGARLFKSKREYFSFFNKSENQLLLSIHSLNDQTVEKYVQKIEEFKPVFMQGHPSAFYFISEWIKKRNYSLNTKIKAIFTTGETLYEDQREIIEHSFKCIVLQNYGQGESVVGAIECPLKSGYHEVSELGLIEVLRNPATGQSEIVGTSLWNTVFPFIRYRIEDTVIAAEKNQCACGINLPLKIKTVLGRNDDIISDYSGDIVFPVTIRMLIKPFLKTSENYQFRQIDSGKYQLLLLTDSVGEFRAKGLEENLKKTLGNAAFLSIEEVKEIRSPSGKVRNIIRLNA